VPPAQAEISLEGEISPAGRGYRARLVSTDDGGTPRGEHVLSTPHEDCRQLHGAIAFVIALRSTPRLSLTGRAAELLAEFAQELPPEQAALAELAALPLPAGARKGARPSCCTSWKR
jgi:hypothetical protein